ncbi:MAG: choice-of-anchor M domain-containing protein [Verrucomicrobiota bacterium JB022]|nr:choice-of-anchor M domain-containing protein [Verrucomicrobiota bacterium JB022]
MKTSDTTQLASSKRVLGLATLLVALTSPTSAAISYLSGHGDIGLGEGSELEPHVHLSAGAVVNGSPLAEEAEFEPGDVRIVVPQSTADYITSIGGRPTGTAWDPLGANAGETFWLLPETNAGAGGAAALNAPFLGIGGEEITLGAFDDNLFTLSLVSASMPAGGDFSIYTFAGFNPSFFMSTANGIDSSDLLTLDLDSADHIHANFAFTQPGLYSITFEIAALQGGTPVSTQATYNFAVVPEPATTAALAGAAALGFIAWRRRSRATIAR